MRSSHLLIGWALLSAFAPGLLPSAAAGEVVRLSESFSFGGARELQLTLPVGEVRLFPGPRDRVSVEARFDCSGDYYPCRDRVTQVSLVREAGDEGLRLRLAGPATWWKTPKSWRVGVEIDVHYPMDAALVLELEQGRVDLVGLEADARIDVKRGAVQVSLLERNAASVDLEVPRGRLLFRDARARRLGDPENPFRGTHRVHWTEGEGAVHLEVRVGRGDALVQLQ